MSPRDRSPILRPHLVRLVVEGELPDVPIHLDELGAGPNAARAKPFGQLRHGGVWWWRASAAFPEHEHELGRSVLRFFCVAKPTGLVAYCGAITHIDGHPVLERDLSAFDQSPDTFQLDYAQSTNRPARRLPLLFAHDLRLRLDDQPRSKGRVTPPYDEVGNEGLEIVLPIREKAEAKISELRFSSKMTGGAWLSTFSPHPIEVDGETWPTVEHYYQGMRTLDLIARRAIAGARSPLEARRLGREALPRANWEEIRVEVMRRALRAKLAQHQELARMLVKTKDMRLVYESPDPFWGSGEGSPGTPGLNRLGQLLMELRERRRSGGDAR